MKPKNTPSASKVLGGILLISGCCIGAGMLGLPVMSAMAGFKPSLVLFIISWLFMVCTGLLLLEVNLWFPEEVSLITMAGRTLGPVGKAITWGGFLFLFYSLMVAYISAGGQLFAALFEQLGGITVPAWSGSLFFICFFGALVYLGTQTVDWFNRLLMLGLIGSYLLLVGFGLSHINRQLLKPQDWSAAPLALPAMLISFGFHNMIPSLKNYLQGHVNSLRLTIIAGSALPLVVYILWEALILGLIPLEGAGGFREALNAGDLATHALKTAIGGSWIADMAHHFAFFALVTSFLAVCLSFVDFLADGLPVKKDSKGRFLLCLLVLGPSFGFALLYPKIFLTALNYAGAFGTVLLFGILPAAMVWAGRYHQGLGEKRLVPGGKILLLLVISFAAMVMLLQMAAELNK